MMHRATVCFLTRDQHILLARKKKKIGKGLWNGYGGFEEAEDATIEHTAVREMKEEIGVSANPSALEKIGVVRYSNQSEGGRLKEVEVHFYLVAEWDGEPHSGEEMDTPTWFTCDALPLDEMLPTDRMWLPRALQGTRFVGVVHHGENKEVVSADFKEVQSFDES